MGAPSIEFLRGRESLTAALSAVTAAVVGVVLNPGLWFAVQVLFESVYRFRDYGTDVLLPVVGTVDLPALGITTRTGILYFALDQGILRTLGAVSPSVSRITSSCEPHQEDS